MAFATIAICSLANPLNYRILGHNYSLFLRNQNPSLSQSQSYLADALADDNLLPTLRDLISRPSFVSIQSFAGSGQGLIERDSLLYELRQTYLPSVIEDITHFLDGILDRDDFEQGERTDLNSENSSRTPEPNLDLQSVRAVDISESSEMSTQLHTHSPSPSPSPTPIFYYSSPWRIFWLTLITAGIYDYLWMYRTWRAMRRYELVTGKPSSPIDKRHPMPAGIPVWAALFSGFFFFGTVRRIQNRLDQNNQNIPIRLWITCLLYWLPVPLTQITDGYRWLSVICFVFAMSVSSFQLFRLQRLANTVNIHECPSETFCNQPFRVSDLFALIIGLIYMSYLILVLYGTLV